MKPLLKGRNTGSPTREAKAQQEKKDAYGYSVGFAGNGGGKGKQHELRKLSAKIALLYGHYLEMTN
jgi:hypothetical protein